MIKYYRLKELCNSIIDCPHSSPKWQTNGIPIIRNYNLINGKIDLSDLSYVDEETYNNRVKRAVPESGDIVISREAPMGAVGMIPDNFRCCMGQRLVLIKVNRKICNPQYLLYALQSEYVQTQIKKIDGTGSIVSNLNIPDLKNLIIPFNKEKQDDISDVLSTIDQKIETNNIEIKTLNSLVTTIYDYWFLQFDFPDENGRPYKSSGGKMVWNEALKREIPEGWTVGTFSDTILMSKNGDWGQEKIKGHFTHKVRCLRGADFPAVSGNDKLVAPYRYILEKNTNKILAPGDIIIEISGGSPTQSTGRSCLVTAKTLERFGEDVITSNFCQAVTLKRIIYSEWFYLTWKALYDNGIFFNYEGKTTGIKNLLFDAVINQILIVIPPRCIMNIFHSLLYDLFEKEQANNIENDQLSSLRDFLLPLLMNGQVTIKD